jgi:hypothetical protein
VVLDQPAFCPTIHLHLPLISFLKPWYKLRPALRFLTSEQVLAPQLFLTVDLSLSAMIRDQWLLSILFLPLANYPINDLFSFHARSQISTIFQHVAPFQTNDYDWFRLSGPREFQLSTIFFSLYGNLPEWNI